MSRSIGRKRFWFQQRSQQNTMNKSKKIEVHQ